MQDFLLKYSWVIPPLIIFSAVGVVFTILKSGPDYTTIMDNRCKNLSTVLEREYKVVYSTCYFKGDDGKFYSENHF